jgi:capsid protein
VPLLAPVIDTAKDLEFYMEATRMQANIAATFGVFITRDNPATFKTMESEAISGGDGTQRAQRLATGMQQWLAPGEKAEMMDPKCPGPQFDPFARFMVRQIAIGMGTTYEYLMQDFSNMSFSSSKTNLMDTTLTLRENQRYLRRGVCEPTFCRWLAMEMASGALPFNPDGYTEHTFDLPAELGIDPVKTADADIKRLAAGLDTIGGIIGPNGEGDLEAHLTRRADEVELIDRLAAERGIDPSRIASWLAPGVASPTTAA